MITGLTFRPETPADADSIHTLTYDAFLPMAFSDNSEADIIRQLRQDGNLALSMVAELAGSVVAHVAFSPVTISDGTANWFGLGPIAVAPKLQKQGVGRQLMAKGLDQIYDMGAAGCVLIGNPAVYASSGFSSRNQLTYLDVPPEILQHITFSGPDPKGEVTYAPALQNA